VGTSSFALQQGVAWADIAQVLGTGSARMQEGGGVEFKTAEGPLWQGPGPESVSLKDKWFGVVSAWQLHSSFR
jgi:hypothetical protein